MYDFIGLIYKCIQYVQNIRYVQILAQILYTKLTIIFPFRFCTSVLYVSFAQLFTQLFRTYICIYFDSGPRRRGGAVPAARQSQADWVSRSCRRSRGPPEGPAGVMSRVTVTACPGIAYGGRGGGRAITVTLSASSPGWQLESQLELEVDSKFQFQWAWPGPRAAGGPGSLTWRAVTVSDSST